MNERELRGVVCLMQPNYIDILKRNKADGIVFSVTTFDGSDKSVQKDISTSVTFKVFEGLPRNYANLHLIASGLISNLADLNQPKVAILVSENDHIRAFVKLESDKPVEEAAVLSLPSRFHLFNNDGIIEPRLLADRKVAVVGLGSGGSHVAMELAKSVWVSLFWSITTESNFKTSSATFVGYVILGVLRQMPCGIASWRRIHLPR